MTKNEFLKQVQTWEQRKGKGPLVKYLKGGRITRQQAILAKCYECNAGWPDGVQNCNNESCPLYPYQPYAENDRECPSS